MKSNITLIGMPGAGKSTAGILLAKNMALGFTDTDLLIQTNRKTSLQEIINQEGYMALRAIEEQIILKLNLSGHVIATGGSVVYSPGAMAHLGRNSHIVFLQVDFKAICQRINNFATRGIARAENQSFAELFEERRVLYEKYADITVNASGMNQEETAGAIEACLSGQGPNFR